MMGGFQRTDGIGDNKEFSVASPSEITIHLGDADSVGKTSANDTATDYYLDTRKSARKFFLRTDQALTITKYNGIALTDPITVALVSSAGSHKQEFDALVLMSMSIQTSTANTNLKIVYL